MKRTTLILFILTLSLAACAAPIASTLVPEATSVPVESNMPAPNTSVTETVVNPQGKLRAPSFESQTYINETVGFALEYPAHWTVQESKLGDRASQALLLSAPEIAELAAVPVGETRVAIVVYQWDPKNDLTAYLDNRKIAWEASGLTILDEEPLTLDLGLAAVRITLQATDGSTMPFLFAAIGDHYVSISGEGDLVLVQEIMQYLRPISK